MPGTTFCTYSPDRQSQILQEFMDLFKGNERGYGVGEFADATQREDDNKWVPGHVRWVWGQPTSDQYRAHLSGELLTGIGVLCDDNRVWFSCLDIDDYEIDYSEVMASIRQTGLPLIVFRTKSGGLRICIFFNESIEADVVIPRMRKLAAMLGYSGCEIFPKQTKLLVEKGDCPSWIYLPYGGRGEDGEGDAIFPEQGCMNDGGNLMEIAEAMIHCGRRRLSREQFQNLFSAEKAADANGKRNGKKHPSRVWVEEEAKQDTIDSMFWDGPVCLRILSRIGVGHGQQNHFLTQCAIFLKKKYENWDKPLIWINYNVLAPVGDKEKLDSIVKRFQHSTYDYLCHEEPMQTYCDSHACRTKKYGVGAGSVGYPDLAMTIINTKPPIFIISVGEVRMIMSAAELHNNNTLQIKFLEQRMPIPPSRKKEDNNKWINAEVEKATIVEPMPFMRTGAAELELLGPWLSSHIRVNIAQGDKNEDAVRLVESERRIYIKWKKLADAMRKHYSEKEVGMLRMFFFSNGEHHEQGPGCRGWFRNTDSLKLDLFDEEQIEEWLGRNPQKEDDNHD